MSEIACPYCDEVPDGDRAAWLTAAKKCCNRPGCVRRHGVAYDMALKAENRRIARLIDLRRGMKRKARR